MALYDVEQSQGGEVTAGERSFVGNDHPPQSPQNATNTRDAQKVEPGNLSAVVGLAENREVRSAKQKYERASANPFESIAHVNSPAAVQQSHLAMHRQGANPSSGVCVIEVPFGTGCADSFCRDAGGWALCSNATGALRQLPSESNLGMVR